MPTLHPRVQATHEHEAQANVQRRQKSEDPNSWTHESQPLDGFTGPLEVFAKDATVSQRTGLLHRMNQRHRIGSLRKLQRHYGNRFVQGLIAQHTVQTRLTVGHSGDIYEQEADRVADAVIQMSQPRSAEQASVSGPVRSLRIQRICGGCEKELRQQPITEEKEEELHRQPLEDEAEEQPIKAKAISNRMDMALQRQISNEERERQGRPGATRGDLCIQRQADDENEENESVQAKSNALARERHQVGQDVETHLSLSKGGGQPMPNEVRAFMEPRFGLSFDEVRIHKDMAAAESAKHIGAAAYTSEKDIYFGSGQYQPHTRKGKELIAHELVHVVQQNEGWMGRSHNAGKSDNRGEALAERVADSVNRSRGDDRNEKITSSIRPYYRSSVQLAPNVTAVAAPAELAAGRGRTARARATAGPGITVAWSIEGNARGATIAGSGRNATITAPAGSTGGPITVRAADAANPLVDFEEANIALVEIQQPTFAFAPPMPALAAANTMDASVCNNTATANALTVPAGRAVRWSLRGNARGATIDPATGVINPSATHTGAVTVRATDNTLRDALAEQVLTIRAHPTKIIRTFNTGAIPLAAGGPYGAVYDHLLASSGGSLLNVDVSEQVFCGSDPFNFCPGVLPVLPGPPNVWPLNAAGRMIGDFMSTLAGNPGIDVNRFLPSPPNPGLPQVLNTPQILYWQSTQCGQWVPFANIPITATLLQRGANFRFVTINNGIRHDEAYIGPALAAAPGVASVCPAGTRVSKVRLVPSVLAADGNAATTAAATAQVRPAATALQWSFTGLNFGAVVVTPTPGAGNPAQIQTGNVAGKITVRAAVVGTPGCFAEGRLTLQRIHIGPISFSPAIIPAGVGNRSRATVGTQPGRREVDWTIQGPALGCVITRNPDNSANIVRGAQRGRVTVRATDHRDATKFSEASVVLS
jgi:Domain of unknown function (DUF4157)